LIEEHGLGEVFQANGTQKREQASVLI